MIRPKFHVSYWKYYDGEPMLGSPGMFPKQTKIPKGWRCWLYIYPQEGQDPFDIDKWMKANMTGKFDCTFRFNSGDPMYTIYIKEQRDAEFFALNFIS